MTTIERITKIWRRFLDALTPSMTAWRGATIGVYLLVAILLVAFFASYFVQDFTFQKLPGFVVPIGILFFVGALAVLAIRLIGCMSNRYRFVLFVFSPIIVFVVSTSGMWQSIGLGFALILIASLIGAGVAVMRSDGFKPRHAVIDGVKASRNRRQILVIRSIVVILLSERLGFSSLNHKLRHYRRENAASWRLNR